MSNHTDDGERRLRIRTLGTFTVHRPGTAIPLTGRGRELLKLLVALGGRDVPLHSLADTLWPSADGDAARTSFDTTLYRLRRALGVARVLNLEHGLLTLERDACRVDVWTLEGLLRNDCAIPHEERATRILALYRGPFLPNDPLEHCYISYREALHRRVLRELERLGASLEQEKRWAAAAELYERALVIDDTHEAFLRGLIRCAGERGEQGELARTLARGERTLLAKLGVRLTRETRELAERYRERAPSGAACGT